MRRWWTTVPPLPPKICTATNVEKIGGQRRRPPTAVQNWWGPPNLGKGVNVQRSFCGFLGPAQGQGRPSRGWNNVPDLPEPGTCAQQHPHALQASHTLATAVRCGLDGLLASRTNAAMVDHRTPLPPEICSATNAEKIGRQSRRPPTAVQNWWGPPDLGKGVNAQRSFCGFLGPAQGQGRHSRGWNNVPNLPEPCTGAQQHLHALQASHTLSMAVESGRDGLPASRTKVEEKIVAAHGDDCTIKLFLSSEPRLTFHEVLR